MRSRATFPIKNRNGNLWTVIISHRSQRMGRLVMAFIQSVYDNNIGTLWKGRWILERIDNKVCSCTSVDFVWSDVVQVLSERVAVVENRKWSWSWPFLLLQKKKLVSIILTGSGWTAQKLCNCRKDRCLTGTGRSVKPEKRRCRTFRYGSSLK